MLTLSHFIFFTLIIYVIYQFHKDLKYLDRKSIFYLLALIIFSFIYAFNIYEFNQYQSLSYGSDSDYFLNILNNIKSNGFEKNQGFNYLVKEKKFLHILIYYPLFHWINSTVFSSFLVLSLNILIYIKLMQSSNYLIGNKFKVKTKLYLSVLAPLVIISFLRDLIILFLIIESLVYLKKYFFFKNKKHIYLFFFFSLLVLFLRPAFSIVLYISYFVIKYNFKFLLLAATFFLIILFYYFQSFSYSMLGAILILQPDDLISTGLDENVIDKDLFTQQFYSIYDLIKFSFIKFFMGYHKMILAPIFSSYLNLFSDDFSKYFYFGLDRKILLVAESFIYNFIILPSFISKTWHLLKFNLNNKYKIEKIILLIYFFITTIYAIKFFGVRSFKIDFITHFLMILFISIYTFKSKNIYVFTLFSMIAINILNIFI